MGKKALIIVDMQNDFLPGGALAVADGDKIIPIINKLTQLPFDLIVATKDWHPADHCSFAKSHGEQPGTEILIDGFNQHLWPIHCVANSKGAEFTPTLDTSKITQVFFKGTDKNIDSYSTFFDNQFEKSTGMQNLLESQQIMDVYLCGLATDYCVRYSALDACFLSYRTFVIIDACKPVNLNPGDEEAAIKEMKKAGIIIVKSSEIFIN
jgi:nicotinamidase/pyrazinamidase